MEAVKQKENKVQLYTRLARNMREISTLTEHELKIESKLKIATDLIKDYYSLVSKTAFPALSKRAQDFLKKN